MVRQIGREIFGVILILGSLFVAMALTTHDPWDPSPLTQSQKTISNLGGAVGASLSDMLYGVFGWAAYFVPALGLVKGLLLLLKKPTPWWQWLGAGLLVTGCALLVGLLDASMQFEGNAGGMAGASLASALSGLISPIGAYMATFALMVSSLIMLSPVSLVDWALEAMRKQEDDDEEEPVEMDEPHAPAATAPEPTRQLRQPVHVEDVPPMERTQVLPAAPAAPTIERTQPLRPLDLSMHKPADWARAGAGLGHEASPASGAASWTGSASGLVYHDRVIKSDTAPLGVEPPLEPPVATKTIAPPSALKSYRLPGVDLLRSYETVARQSEEDVKRTAQVLERKFLDYGVKGQVTQVHAGPVVNMYEFIPAAGVKINKVVSLAEDVALSLKAANIRIQAVPGTSALGVEVPNLKREIVSFRDIAASESFKKSRSKITLAMGKDIFGTSITADLERMPHLLVAGTTGSGKSVGINCMVMSILYRARPDEVKMLMIDPKLLELSVYEGIPHLIAPVVTSPKEAAAMLKKMVFEMERRYRVIADKGMRNIEGFNSVATEEERLPYIVIFIDELADLMLASAGQVEDSITRLAQMARAAGMHLVLATQRPSVDVITGLIKANFPARIAFQVRTKIDSRTILDSQGAEQLIGKGDMLMMLPGDKMVRVHGALVTESEVHDVVRFVKAQGKPDYSLLENIEAASAQAEAEAQLDEDRDELYWKAVEFAEQTGEVSISSVQRRLKVGYNRAARILELMGEDGLVAPPKGAGKPRDFLGRQG